MKGVYVLIISVDKDIKVNVGALGSTFFERGLYAYVGSAQNGLERRVQRHLRKAKKKFWHIDYLLDDDAVRVVKVFYKEAEKSEECRIAGKLGEVGVPVVNFGCSDCGCVSHLFVLKDYGEGDTSTFLVDIPLKCDIGDSYANHKNKKQNYGIFFVLASQVLFLSSVPSLSGALL